MPWVNLDTNSHTRLWEHLNNLWTAVLERVSSFVAAHTPLIGADPPAGTGYKTIVWSGTVTTSAAAIATVTLPEAFSNGVVGVVVSNCNSGMNITAALDTATSTVSVLKLKCYFAADSSLVASTPVTLTVLAVGW